MPRSILIAIFTLLISSCGGSSDANSSVASTRAPIAVDNGTTTPPAPATTATTVAVENRLAFCQAATELNTTLVLSAFSDLAGEGSQDLSLLAKLPELAAIATSLAASAPAEFAAEATVLSEFYRSANDLATEQGLATTDLETLTAGIDAEELTIEQLYAELGITPDDVTGIFERAAVSMANETNPAASLLGASPADLGCPAPDQTVAACDLLDADDLNPILGSAYSEEAKELPEIGSECAYKAQDSNGVVHVVLAGPSFYLPSVWNEVTNVDGIGDEAFLTSGLGSPFLYVRQGDTALSVSAYNIDPPLTTDDLVTLARAALTGTGG